MRPIHRRTVIAVIAAALSMLLAGIASAHVHEHVGEYELTIGWQLEPAYVGQVNAVAVGVARHDGEPVTDLAAGDLTVVVSTGDQRSDPLELEPAFDPEEGFGEPGEYTAVILPTAPGAYSFHISGAIHDQPVDVAVTSGEDTFDPISGTSAIEFPAKLPAAAEIVTRLDRIDGRIEALGQDAVTASDLDAALAAAAEAREAADQALWLGVGVGVAGLLVGLFATFLALRARDRPA